LDGTEGARAVSLDGQAQLPGDGLVHVEHVAGGEVDVEEAVQARVQGACELTAGGGLARAGLAGDQADAAQLDQVGQAHLGLAQGGGGEQFIGLRRALEGEVGQSEVREVHGGLAPGSVVQSGALVLAAGLGLIKVCSRSELGATLAGALAVLFAGAGGARGSVSKLREGRLRRTKQLA